MFYLPPRNRKKLAQKLTRVLGVQFEKKKKKNKLQPKTETNQVVKSACLVDPHTETSDHVWPAQLEFFRQKG